MSHPSLAVLISGGLDSAILLGDQLRRSATIAPLYVRCGLCWESVELASLHRYLDALHRPNLQPLTILEQPVADLYEAHWSITGANVPDAASPDAAVFLPGRNVLLLGKALLWCHLRKIPALALGSLPTNPFPDATPEFFRRYQEVIDEAMQGKVEVRLPFAGLKKSDVMLLGQGLPLQHTFSCLAPANELHCGRCNKCAERKCAFAEAQMPDPTRYKG